MKIELLFWIYVMEYYMKYRAGMAKLFHKKAKICCDKKLLSLSSSLGALVGLWTANSWWTYGGYNPAWGYEFI